jgi:dTDP-4-amino-4,6-dideoxygalactose transaminase
VIARLASVVRNQARNFRKIATRGPLVVPPLSSATVDADDVKLARALLREQGLWYDDKVVKEYERQFAQWSGARSAFAFVAGRVALSAIIEALQLGPGDEVIIPGYTCVVVPNAFRFAGVSVVCCDIELDTYGPDVAEVERAITRRTKAVLLHHLYGYVARDYLAIVELCRSRGLFVIEDCVQATGATLDGIKVGNRGDAAFFSSEYSKVFCTGRGGVATTSQPWIAERLQAYADRAAPPTPDLVAQQLKGVIRNYYANRHPQRWWISDLLHLFSPGDELISTTSTEIAGLRPNHYVQRMPGAVAALAINQLAKIDRYNEVRRAGAERWEQWAEREGLPRPVVIENSVPVCLRYPVRVKPELKADLNWASEALGVYPGRWFTSNFHPAPVRLQNCPRADEAVATCINLPTIDVAGSAPPPLAAANLAREPSDAAPVG